MMSFNGYCFCTHIIFLIYQRKEKKNLCLEICLYIIGFQHGFETGWGNPYTSCGPSVLSPRVSVANEGDKTEEPQRVYG